MQTAFAILRPEGARSRRFRPKHKHLTRRLLNAILDHEDDYVTPITTGTTATTNLYKLWSCNLRYTLHGEPHTKRVLGSVCTSTICRVHEFGCRIASSSDSSSCVFMYNTEPFHDRRSFDASHGTGITMCEKGKRLMRRAIREMLAHIASVR